MKSAKQFMLALCVVSLFAASCEEEEDNNTTSAENNQIGDAAFSHLGQIVETEVKYYEDSIFPTGFQEEDGVVVEDGDDNDVCADVTISLNQNETFIDTLIIDYGTEGCIWRGRLRRGKIIIAKNGNYRTVGTKTTVTLDDFSIDGYEIEGKKEITRDSYQISTNNIYFTDNITVTDGLITSPNGINVFTWESQRTHKIGYVNGEWVTIIEGVINGVNTQGAPFTITTGTPVKFSWTCPRIVEGTLNITHAGSSTHVLNYGDGTCDDKATVTINGTVYNITLW